MKIINKFDRLKFFVPLDRVKTTKANYFQEKIGQKKDTLEIYTEKYSVPQQILRSFLGINEISIKNDQLLIDITGKIAASQGNFGLIDKNNIEKVFQTIENTGICKFQSLDFNELQLLLTDVTKDITVNNKLYYYFSTLALAANASSQKQKILPYKDGILCKQAVKKSSDSFTIYSKYAEIKKAKTNYKKNYISCIGEDFFNENKQTLRFERHLTSFNAIRNAFEIKEKIISLADVLNSHQNVVKTRFEEIFLSGCKEVF